MRFDADPLHSAAMSWKVLITARTMNDVGASALQLLRDAGCDIVTPPKLGPLSADELATLLGRTRIHLVNEHLRPMIAAGELARTIPDQASHPQQQYRATVPPEERAILETAPSLAGYLVALKQRERGRGTLALRKLLRMLREYPREAFLAALATATEYGLFDLDRVERLVLRNVARDFFPSALLEADTNDHEEPDHE